MPSTKPAPPSVWPSHWQSGPVCCKRCPDPVLARYPVEPKPLSLSAVSYSDDRMASAHRKAADGRARETYLVVVDGQRVEFKTLAKAIEAFMFASDASLEPAIFHVTPSGEETRIA